MKVRSKTTWVLLLSFVLMFSAFCMMARDGEAKQGFVGTETCIACHHTWLDNNPSAEDTASGNVDLSYPPLNLSSSRTGFPFYTIPEGYVNSLHYITAFDLTTTDHVKCEDCHGSGIVHYGIGAIPNPIPGTKTCTGCHTPEHGFDVNAFLATSHANKNRMPKKFYDQGNRGTSQAKVTLPGGEKAFLVKAGTFGPEGGPVTKNERIQECSVCHSYALNYPQFQKKIAHGKMPNPEVRCGACHDSHIVAPNGLQPAIVTSTVKVTALSGSPTPNTVTSVEPAPGREVRYINNKPYKVNAEGAQDDTNGVWARGSAYNVPNVTLVKGAGLLSTEHGVSDLLTLNCDPCVGGGGLLKNGVKPHDTVFIWGEASATVNLPADAKDAGKPVTVRANFETAGFVVEEVIDDKTLLIESRTDSDANRQLGNENIAVVTKVNVTYAKTAGGNGTLAVVIPLSGLVQFEIRDMYTNTETLCGSCHTQGTYKYTKWGTIKNGEVGAIVDLSATHNKNVYGQYLLSGHADRQALAFKEFNSSDYGSSHQQTYPFDMSITGSGGINSLRNKGNMRWKLTSSPNLANAYLVASNNTDLYGTSTTTLINNYACFQCHHGLASIDYQLDRQGTSEASVLWGDANVTCATCHDPHKDQTGSGKNIRVPVKLSYNSRFVDAAKNPRGGINKFMDGTDIPAGVKDGIICLFCHQGRESGLTVYMNISGRNVNPYTEPDKVIVATGTGLSFQNPHYLESGAILWSKNNWEYFFNNIPQQYSSGIPSHQNTNCTGCHMSEASPDNVEGGHTWRPRIETCQQCHGPIQSFHDIQAGGDFNGNGIVESAFAEIGTINPDSGLFGQVKAALAAKGIFYNPDTYPYYFNAAGGSFTAWTTNTLTAAFNLSFLFKAGNCAYVHNVFYSAQILQDSLRALGVTPTGVRPPGNRNAIDYRTIVVNP